MILLLVGAESRTDGLAGAFVTQHPSTVVVRPEPGSTDPAVRTCAAITDLAPSPPLVVVSEGAMARTLPAVARSQTAHHRRVVEYVLLDPELPPVSDTWPDARVTVVCGVDSEASLQARLRGWDVLRPEDLPSWSPPD